MTTVVAVRCTQFDIGDIAEAQPGPVDREVTNFIDRCEFAARADTEALIASRDLAGADGEIAADEQVAD